MATVVCTQLNSTANRWMILIAEFFVRSADTNGQWLSLLNPYPYPYPYPWFRDEWSDDEWSLIVRIIYHVFVWLAEAVGMRFKKRLFFASIAVLFGFVCVVWNLFINDRFEKRRSQQHSTVNNWCNESIRCIALRCITLYYVCTYSYILIYPMLIWPIKYRLNCVLFERSYRRVKNCLTQTNCR